MLEQSERTAFDTGVDARGQAADERPQPSPSTTARRFTLGLLAMIAALAAVGLTLTSTGPLAGVRNWDASISEDVAEGRTAEHVDLARFISDTGDTRPIVGLLLIVTAVLLVARQWRAAIVVPLAMLAEISTFLAVNYLVGRPRPTVDKIGPIPGTYSFPSGHVAATFVCWVGPAILLYAYGHRRAGQVLAAAGTLLAVAMGWARVYVGMHYTLDVTLGLLMGMAALAVAIRATELEFR